MRRTNTIEPAPYLAYSDETHHNTGRYRGIGLITLSRENAEMVGDQVRDIIAQSSVSELKWGELKSAKRRFAAKLVLNYIIEKTAQGMLRIDVLTWDIEDSRHKVQGRDDLQNLRRMYYFLFKNVLCKRWPSECVWELRVDESTSRPWSHLDQLREILDWDTGQVIAEVKVQAIREVQSHREPLIQVADLFAGLGVYSRNAYERYARWLTGATSRTRGPVSRSDSERFDVLVHLDQVCKTHRLGVSLKHKGGLRTFNPSKPINFWWYEPQGDYDRAPL